MPRQAWLCVAPLVACVCDVALTLQGQDECYWQGDYGEALESNPLAHPFLACHPLIFVAGTLVYAITFMSILRFWKHRLSIVLSFLLTFGHAIGSATWLARKGILGWFALVVLLFLFERLFTFGMRRAGLTET